MSNDGKIFTTIKEISKESGIPYRQILNDINNRVLPAIKKGKSYYIYTTDASDYYYKLVCQARGQDPEKYRSLLNGDIVNQVIGSVLNNDKSKD